MRSLRWGVGEFGLEEVEVAGDLGVLGAAAAGDAVQAHALARDGDTFELVARADSLRQTAADGERVRRADDGLPVKNCFSIDPTGGWHPGYSGEAFR